MVYLEIDESTKERLETHKPDYVSMDVYVNQILRDSMNYRCLNALIDELETVEDALSDANDSLDELRARTHRLEAEVVDADESESGEGGDAAAED